MPDRFTAIDRAVLTLAFLVAAAGVGAVVQLNRPDRGDPDPGGRILAALVATESVIPASASNGVAVRQAVEPQWDSCNGRPGTQGWDDATVFVQFGIPQDPDTFLDAADVKMHSLGWSSTTLAKGYGSTGKEWLRTLPDGTPAHVILWLGQRDGTLPTSWALQGDAPPHGRRASGC